MPENDTVDKEEFVEKWNGHIGQLTRLGWHLTKEDQEKLDELKDDLREFVETAAENKERADEQGVQVAYRETDL